MNLITAKTFHSIQADCLGRVAGTNQSALPQILGPTRTSPVKLFASNDASLVYYNPYIIKEFDGVEVPFGNPIHAPEFQTHLIRKWAQRIDGDTSKQPITGVWSRYGTSEGIKGDGRCVYLDDGVMAKGIGKTDAVGEDCSASHANGYSPVPGGIFEAINLEVLLNLKDVRGPVIATILGLNQLVKIPYSIYPEPLEILLRAGLHTRNAHYIASNVYLDWARWANAMVTKLHGKRVDQQMVADANGNMALKLQDNGPVERIDPLVFFKLADANGFLEWHYCKEEDDFFPDIDKTFDNLIKACAVSCAEDFRWGLMHGTPSGGNTGINDSFIDSLTVISNPRRGPVFSHPGTFPFGAPEFQARVWLRILIYRTLKQSLTAREKKAYNFKELKEESFFKTFDKEYKKRLGLNLIKALGLKGHLAFQITEYYPQLTHEFRDLIEQVALLQNPGPPPMVKDFDGKNIKNDAPLHDIAVADAFNLIRHYASLYFETNHDPTEEDVMRLLNIRYIVENNEDAAKKEHNEKTIKDFAPKFIKLYHRIMTLATQMGHSYYDDEESMAKAIVSRAEFENRPAELNCWWELDTYLTDVLKDSLGIEPKNHPLYNPVFVTRLIRRNVERSLRNTAKLTTRGERILREGKKLDIGVMTWNYISTGITTDLETGQRNLFVRIPVDTSDKKITSLALPKDTAIDLSQIALTYTASHDQADSQAQTIKAKPRLEKIRGRRYLVFEIPVSKSQNGYLQGRIETNDESEQIIPIFPYAFSVPDNKDIDALIEVFDPTFGDISSW